MKQLMTVLGFEYRGYVKAKGFIAATIAFVILIGGVLSFPRFSGLFAGLGESNDTGTILLAGDFSNIEGGGERVAQELTKGFPDMGVDFLDRDESALEEYVDSGACKFAIYVNSDMNYTLYTKTAGLNDTRKYVVDSIMNELYRESRLKDMGLNVEETQNLLNESVKSELVATGKDQRQNFFYTYGLLFLLYFAVLMYGQFVAMGVATEKSSRAMELLITSAKPTNLMFGKIFGAGLAGLTQMCAILVGVFVFYNINAPYWENNVVVQSIFNMPLEMLLYTLLFFVLGFFMYAFLYGAAGSLVSKIEDVSSSIMPFMLIFMAQFFIAMFSMVGGAVDSLLMKIASFVPLTSAMTMFVRISMGVVSAVEIVISVLILIVSIIIVGYIAAKIYRIGVTLYGKRPSMKNVLKSLMFDK